MRRGRVLWFGFVGVRWLCVGFVASLLVVSHGWRCGCPTWVVICVWGWVGMEMPTSWVGLSLSVGGELAGYTPSPGLGYTLFDILFEACLDDYVGDGEAVGLFAVDGAAWCEVAAFAPGFEGVFVDGAIPDLSEVAHGYEDSHVCSLAGFESGCCFGGALDVFFVRVPGVAALACPVVCASVSGLGCRDGAAASA